MCYTYSVILTFVFNKLVQDAGLSSSCTPNHQELEQEICAGESHISGVKSQDHKIMEIKK